MAKLWYEPKSGGAELQSWEDPQVLVKTDIESNLAGFQLFRGLADSARTLLAQGGIPGAGIQGGWPDLASFDAYLDEEIDRFRDILDYFDYGSTAAQLTVRDGSWWVPEALESVSDENVGEEGVLAIDGDNSSWWQSDTPATREIVFRLRDYKKKITGIRLRSTSGDLRAQVQNVTIKGAQGLGAIDDPGNVLDTGVNFTYGADPWIEHTLPSPKLLRYIKLEVPGSLHASHVRIREIQAFVTIINHDK